MGRCSPGFYHRLARTLTPLTPDMKVHLAHWSQAAEIPYGVEVVWMKNT